MIQTILSLPVENQIFFAVLGFSWTVYLWEAYLSYRQVSLNLVTFSLTAD